MENFNPANHGPWSVAHLVCGVGVSVWQVYRLRDKDAVDHSGNREYVGPVFDSEPEARVWLEVNKGVLPE